MKNNILIKGLAAVMIAGVGTSCSSDYLDLKPETSIDASMVHTTIEGAELAMNGVYRSQWMMYGNWAVGQRMMQGEAWMHTFYGDVFSPDAYYNVWDPYGARVLNWRTMNDKGTWIPQIGWQYCYNLINQCNEVLSGIDTMESGTAEQRARVKAQALAMRAHAYIRLLQLYAPRWDDAEGGEKYVCVLRLTPGTGDMPLAKHKDVLDQIYVDLTESINLFTEFGFTRPDKFAVDLRVAQGLFARAALLKNDYQKAYDMAKAARSSYPIMSGDEYMAGFAEPNGEWMWNNYPDYEFVGFWAWQSIYACNGKYVSYWGQGAGAMSYDLYKQMDANDIRRELYWMPDKTLRRPLTSASFWNEKIVDPLNMNCNSGNQNMQISINAFGESRIPNGDLDKWGKPYSLESEDGAAENVIIPFGAQYKFWGLGDYSVASFPFMRGAEMLLYQAEAAYRLGHPEETQQLLVELNSKRIEGYTCTKTGDELFKELMFTSRVELWGEGFTWFNMKRWNVTIERNVWEAGNVNSNNIPAPYKMTKLPSDNCGWIYAIPNSELQYNHAIDQSQLLTNGATDIGDVPEEGGDEGEGDSK